MSRTSEELCSWKDDEKQPFIWLDAENARTLLENVSSPTDFNRRIGYDVLMDAPPTPRDSGGVSEKVIDAVAEAEGIEPVDVAPPLYEVVDPEALDRVFAPSTGDQLSGEVTFSYSGHEITVGADGEVLVYSDAARSS